MLRRAILFGAMAIMAAAWPSLAAEGDLKAVAVSSDHALAPRPVYASQGDFVEAKSGSGTVNASATVASLRVGEKVFLVAVDSTKADAKAPNVLRFDFSGKGKFAAALVVPLKSRTPAAADWFQASFGPTTLKVPRKGKTIPVVVTGNYVKSGTYRRLDLRLWAAMEGTCRFGDKVRAVRVIDGNSNLSFRDVYRSGLRRGRAVGMVGGDTVAVDAGDGKFAKPTKVLYGQPVLVEGKWYQVDVSKDETKVSARQVDVATGQIKIDHDKWSVRLVGKKHILCLAGGKAPQTVPADQYVIETYQEWAPTGAGRRPGAQVRLGWRSAYTGKSPALAVTAGKVTNVAVGSPLIAQVDAQKARGSSYILSLKLTDAAGRDVENLSIPGARSGRPDPPKVKILDAGGKTVFQTTLEYG